jgi:hypothetical protein
METWSIISLGIVGGAGPAVQSLRLEPNSAVRRLIQKPAGAEQQPKRCAADIRGLRNAEGGIALAILSPGDLDRPPP